MQFLKTFLLSSNGRKYLMSASGLLLVGFVIVHLLGNLQLLIPDDVYFNKYAHHILSLGPLLWLAEIGLIALFGLHIAVAIAINLQTMRARPQGYLVEKTKGGDSKWNLSSRHMFILGVVLAVFVVTHVWHFKFGPGEAEGYVVVHDGTEMRDLYSLVIQEFSKPLWVLFYVGCMVVLGLHLRHGIWSGLQSLGAMPGNISKGLYVAGVVLAILLAVGFLFLPLWIFFDFFNLYEAYR